MHSAVNPKPVAAVLATFWWSASSIEPSVRARSGTRPVDGSACSQKYWQERCSKSSRKLWSRSENLVWAVPSPKEISKTRVTVVDLSLLLTQDKMSDEL